MGRHAANGAPERDGGGVTNIEALERLARDEGATNLALRNALLEVIALLRFRTEQLHKELGQQSGL